jgi:hypothetical protein
MSKPSAAIVVVCLAGVTVQAVPQNNRAGSSVTIKAKASTVKLGSAILVEVTLSNITDHAIAYIPGDAGEDIDVLDDKGAAVRATKAGEVYKGVSDNRTVHPDGTVSFEVRSSSGQVLSMEPGGSGTHEIDVSKLFDFQKPGKYTVQVKRLDVDTRVVAKSNLITITVLR